MSHTLDMISRLRCNLATVTFSACDRSLQGNACIKVRNSWVVMRGDAVGGGACTTEVSRCTYFFFPMSRYLHHRVCSIVSGFAHCFWISLEACTDIELVAAQRGKDLGLRMEYWELMFIDCWRKDVKQNQARMLNARCRDVERGQIMLGVCWHTLHNWHCTPWVVACIAMCVRRGFDVGCAVVTWWVWLQMCGHQTYSWNQSHTQYIVQMCVYTRLCLVWLRFGFGTLLHATQCQCHCVFGISDVTWLFLLLADRLHQMFPCTQLPAHKCTSHS